MEGESVGRNKDGVKYYYNQQQRSAIDIWPALLVWLTEQHQFHFDIHTQNNSNSS